MSPAADESSAGRVDGRASSHDIGSRPQTEALQIAASAMVDAQALKLIDNRHEVLQAEPAGAMTTAAARTAAVNDVAALDSFADKALQGRAAAVMGNTAHQHPTYKSALKEISPQYADLADRAYAQALKDSAAKEDRKALEFADLRDAAAASIAARYSAMAGAGQMVKDLPEPALERLAIKDSRDLLLIDSFPPHARAGEAQALVAQSMRSDGYRATFERERAEWTAPSVDRQLGRTANTTPRAENDANSMRAVGDTTAKRRAIPPLEDRFNVMRTGLITREFRFRDQAGKVAFTDRLMSINIATDSPAAVKAMVDRAAERGWQTVQLKGSPEFVRQGWIAANAQGLTAVGHTPTDADRDAAAKERTRLQANQDALSPSAPGPAAQRIQPAHRENLGDGRSAEEFRGNRPLLAAIEKALVNAKVPPEIRGQMRSMMAAEGARRVSGGERFNVPVYDPAAARARSAPVQAVAPRSADRERSR